MKKFQMSKQIIFHQLNLKMKLNLNNLKMMILKLEIMMEKMFQMNLKMMEKAYRTNQKMVERVL